MPIRGPIRRSVSRPVRRPVRRINPKDYIRCKRCGHQRRSHLFALGQGIDASHPCNMRAECGCFDFRD